MDMVSRLVVSIAVYSVILPVKAADLPATPINYNLIVKSRSHMQEVHSRFTIIRSKADKELVFRVRDSKNTIWWAVKDEKTKKFLEKAGADLNDAQEGENEELIGKSLSFAMESSQPTLKCSPKNNSTIRRVRLSSSIQGERCGL